MNVLLIEQEKTELANLLSLTASPRKRLLHLFRYYNIILKSQSRQIKNSYLPEFIEIYIQLLQQYETFGIPPKQSEQILTQIKELCYEKSLLKFTNSLNEAHLKLTEKYDYLKSVLNGNENKSGVEAGLFIPLIEKFKAQSFENIGLLETVTINIKEEKFETKFLISPSNKEIEKAIIEQIKTSWGVAQNYVSQYFKTKPHHCVIIQFDHRYGEYVGDSLGAALTLEFIKELHRFYLSKINIGYNCKSAVTGGVDTNGNIKGVSKEIVEKKTEIVFYSDVRCLVVTEDEKQYAKNKLEELKKEFPKRELEIIGVEDINDLMNRRNLILLNKEKFIIRSSKFLYRNKFSFILLSILVATLIYARLYDFDTNPKILENKGNILIVKNKNGKELWKRITLYNNETLKYYKNYKGYQKIVDVDDDGINEVIINADNDKEYDNVKYYQTSCLDNKGNIIWKYVFKDSIETNEMVHSKMYHSVIIDTVTIENQKALAMVSKNEFYPSALYFLNLKTGKRIGPTMWHSGHMHTGLFGDFNNDGKKELVMLGINNFYERSILLSVNIDDIKGQLPTDGKYKFKNLPLTKVNEYILLPKSDVNDYYKLRFNTNTETIDYYNKKYFLFSLLEGQAFSDKTIMYKFDNNLKLLLIDPSDYFRVARDSLVAKGKLLLPYTGTKEYKEILKSQIRYWDGKKFVAAEKYFKNKAAQ